MAKSGFGIQDIDKYIENTKKKKEKKHNKKKSNKKLGNRKFNNPHLLLKSKTIKKNKKNYDELLTDGFESLARELHKVYNDKNCKLDRETIYDAFETKVVAKAFIEVCENYMEEDLEIPSVYMYMISDFYLSKVKTVRESKHFKGMLKMYKKVNKKKIKTIAEELKKCGVNKKQAQLSALHVCLISQSFEGDKRSKNRVYMFMNELYKAFNDGEKIKEKSIAKIIYTCFNKRMMFFIRLALQEKANVANHLKSAEEREVHSVVTNIVLHFIEKKLDKDDRKELLKNYAKSRQNTVNIKKRVNFTSLNDDDYRNILKTIDRLIDHGYNKELFE